MIISFVKNIHFGRSFVHFFPYEHSSRGKNHPIAALAFTYSKTNPPTAFTGLNTNPANRICVPNCKPSRTRTAKHKPAHRQTQVRTRIETGTETILHKHARANTHQLYRSSSFIFRVMSVYCAEGENTNFIETEKEENDGGSDLWCVQIVFTPVFRDI